MRPFSRWEKGDVRPEEAGSSRLFLLSCFPARGRQAGGSAGVFSSDAFVDRMDALLEHPTTDPHGDPIPDRAGRPEVLPNWPLSAVHSSQQVIIHRVSDEDPALLRYLSALGLVPGTKLEILEATPFGDVYTVLVAMRPVPWEKPLFRRCSCALPPLSIQMPSALAQHREENLHRTYSPLPASNDEPEGVGVALEHLVEEAGTHAALDGHTKGILRILPFLGPAFIAFVAYIDPGNYATNIQGSSTFGYKLLWVIVLAKLMAMLLQTISAKLGLATGHNLAEMCRLQFRKPVVIAMWIASEIAAIRGSLVARLTRWSSFASSSENNRKG